MHLDIGELSAFYASPMGGQVRGLLAAQIAARWRTVKGLTVMGLGYPTPYLEPFLFEAGRIGALMPAQQGYRRWPSSGPARTIAVEEERLPLPDASVDRLLAVHAVEMADGVKRTLREIWRVLRPEGRTLIIVPNRRSIWAHRDVTPFGEGQPFTRQQLQQLLSGGLFQIEYCGFALAPPPVRWGPLWRYARTTERVGARLWPAVSGVIVLEAVKQVSAVLPKGTPAPATIRLRTAAAGGPRTSWRGGAHERAFPGGLRADPAASTSRSAWSAGTPPASR